MRANDNEHPLQLERAPEPSADSAISLKDILIVLRREWRWPVFGCLIGLMVAVAYIILQPTLYSSNARILVDRSLNRYLQTNKIIDQPTLDQAELESQIHILSSEIIVLPVIRSMNLTRDSEFVGPPSALGPKMLWNAGELLKDIRQYLGWQEEAVVPSEDMLKLIVVDSFLKRLSVYREDVASVITVAFQSEDPHKAARVANAVADTYLATSLEAKSKTTKIASEWLQERLTALKVQAIEADRALQNYKIANNLVEVDKGLKSSDQLASLNAQLNNARMSMAEAKARFERIQHTISEGVPSATVTDALNSSIIVRLRTQYLDLAAKASEIEARVGPGHLAVTKLHERMSELLVSIRAEEQRLAGSYASEYEIAKARESEVALAISKMAGDAKTKSQAEVTMRDIESSADTFRLLYASFLQKFQEMSASQTQAIATPDARILTRATPALRKNPRKAVAVLAGSLMLGLFLGAGAALAREFTADVFRTPNLVRDVTGVHCVMLPTVAAKRKLPLPFHRSESQLIEEVVLNEPYSRFTESLRGIKVLINTAHAVDDVKVVGVVSSVPKEGKTVVAANLAALMVVTTGVRTLVIDADLHLRLLTARLAPDAREGLIEALADPSRLSSLVYKRVASGLDVLPCVLSSRIPNSAELLGSPQMEQLLAAARKIYDYIIVEIPPIMSVVDLMMIERFIDRFIFVVEWGQTSRSLVKEALSEAEVIRERLIGVVLNKADPVALTSIEAYKGGRFGDYYEG